MQMTLPSAAVAAIERATLDAVAPDPVQACGQWLLALDAGTVGRAHSAVPLAHTPPAIGDIDTIETRYVQHGLRTVFRLPQVSAFDAFRLALQLRGYRAHQATQVQTASVADVLALPAPPSPAPAAALGKTRPVLTLRDKPSAAWASVFLGDGFDAVDGAHRVRLLGRALHAQFASVRAGSTGDNDTHQDDDAQADSPVLACGMGSYSQGWASVHGMRTAQSHRGQGLATQVLCALAAHAHGLGLTQIFLQVDAANTAAMRLYARAGFRLAWTYDYWRRAV